MITAVINDAIARITGEMMKANDPLITMIEEHLTEICTTEAVAEKLLREGKTLKGASKVIWAEASKRKQGSGAHIPDAECCEMAEEYFEITEEDKAGRKKTVRSDVIDITQFL